MQDRTDLFRRFTGKGKEHGDIELGDMNAPQQDEGMTQFYEEVAYLKTAMKRIEENIAAIEDKYAQNLNTFIQEKANEITEELEGLIQETNKCATDVSARLKRIGQENKQQSQSPNATTRIRESMHNTLSKKFYDLMSAYQELKSKNATKYREKVKRQVEITSGQKPDDEQLDEILEAGDPNQLFAAKILQDKRHEDAANALIFIQGRHDDIMKLEKSINELHQLFLDMATLVETQGEMLDQIEFQVGKSLAFTDDAVVQLKTAAKHARKGRKIMCCIIIVVIVVLVIIAGVIVAILATQTTAIGGKKH